MMPAGLLRGVLAYRGFIVESVKREFQQRYRNSVLGLAWTLLNPLASILVYLVVFAQLMRARLPGMESPLDYGVFLCVGILTWGLFAEIVGRCQNVFLDNANLIKKISFPRATLPVISILGALLNFAIVFGLFLCALVILGGFPGWRTFAILPVLAVEILLAVGLGTVVGVLNVFFRDIGQFVGVLMQFWFWLTPIVYPVGILADEVRAVVKWNPLAPVIMAAQGVFLNAGLPRWESLGYPLLLGVFCCAWGWRLFRRRVGEMVDEL